MDALAEVKKRRDPKSNVMLFASLMEEVVEYGVRLLELETEEKNDVRDDADAKSQSFILAYVESSDYLLCDALLTDLQRICRVEAEFGLLLSVSALRDPEKCEAKLKQLIKPETLFAQDDGPESNKFQPAEALKETAISLSLYTSSHVKEIHDTLFTRNQQQLPAQVARLQAPTYTLELLRYALCMCEKEYFDETLILFKNTMLVNEIRQVTQHNISNDRVPWTLYPRRYRGDACALSSDESLAADCVFAPVCRAGRQREGAGLGKN
ncbi:hypothetical protein PI125_g24398 [Phytophthora idaei]|nr:hypothetical protein PI125_g24398 [Phytophthora idaei]